MPMNETASPATPADETTQDAALEQPQTAATAINPAEAILGNLTAEKRAAAVFPGLIGALLGVIPGVVLWIILGQLGYIAGICGWLMVRGAIFGYTKLAGAIDRKGEIFATIIAVFMPLVSEYLGIAVSVYRTFHKVDGTTVLDSLASVPLNLSDPDILRGIIINLVIGYVLFAIGFIRFTPKQKNPQQSQLPRL